MPDPNKFQKLRDAGFKITPSCASCIHWERTRRPAWGLCATLTYLHQKHTGPKRVGTPSNGHCEHYKLDMDPLDSEAQSYVEFYEDQETPR